MAQAVLTPPVDPAPVASSESSPAAQGADRAAPSSRVPPSSRSSSPSASCCRSLREAIAFFIDVAKGRCWSIGLVPTARNVRHPDPVDRHLPGHGHRHGRGRPARPGRGDLPLGVRQPRVRKVVKPILEILAGIPSVVLGLLRPHAIINPGARPAVLLRRLRCSTSLRRRRGRRADPAAHGLGVGGRHARGAWLAAGSVVRPRGPAPHDIAAGGLPGARSRASPPPSSSRCRGLSARRWWSPSRPAPRRRPAQLGSAQPGQTMTAAMAALGCGLATR